MRIELDTDDTGSVTLWALGSDGNHFADRAIADKAGPYSGLFPSLEAAREAALALATEVQPYIVTEGCVSDAGKSRMAPTDAPELRDWLSTRDPRNCRLETRAVGVAVVATEYGADVRWYREDRALVVRLHVPTTVIDGVTYSAPAREEVVEESPWFTRSQETWAPNGTVLTPRIYRVAIRVNRTTLRFARGRWGAS